MLRPREHYNYDPVSIIPGAGPLGYLVKDQLHPPMVDDELLWKDGSRWHEGAIRHTLEAVSLCGLQQGNRVLDVGCGVGGPARTLVDCFGVHVFGINISSLQLETCSAINQTNVEWKHNITVVEQDCQSPYPWEDLDCAISLNMLYHVPDQSAMLKHVFNSLREGGKLLLDDWMLTPRANDDDRRELGRHFVSDHFAVREDLISTVADHGFRIRRFVELGHIGRTHLANHFKTVFEKDFRSLIEKEYGPYGHQVANDLVDGIDFSIRLYREEKLTYCRILAEKA